MMNENPIYKTIELTGTSTETIEMAVEAALARASETVRKMCWFQVVEVRGSILDGRVHHYQVIIKIGFELEAG